MQGSFKSRLKCNKAFVSDRHCFDKIPVIRWKNLLIPSNKLTKSALKELFLQKCFETQRASRSLYLKKLVSNDCHLRGHSGMTSPKICIFGRPCPSCYHLSLFFLPPTVPPKKFQTFVPKRKLWNTSWYIYDASHHKLSPKQMTEEISEVFECQCTKTKQNQLATYI